MVKTGHQFFLPAFTEPAALFRHPILTQKIISDMRLTTSTREWHCDISHVQHASIYRI
ncbi:hypothetical protein EMIT0196MI5_140092 [Pseudomonas sp. IT-196MI5]